MRGARNKGTKLGFETIRRVPAREVVVPLGAARETSRHGQGRDDSQGSFSEHAAITNHSSVGHLVALLGGRPARHQPMKATHSPASDGDKQEGKPRGAPRTGIVKGGSHDRGVYDEQADNKQSKPQRGAYDC